MKKPFNLRLVPVYILIVAFFSLAGAGTTVAIIAGGADVTVLAWFIPVLALLCIGFAVASTTFFMLMKKRYDNAFDQILSAFSHEQTEALKSLNGGEPSPEQLSRWVCEQAERTKKAGEDVLIKKAVNELSSEIFWSLSEDASELNFGTYWGNTYGYNDLEKTNDIRNIISDNTKPEFERAVKNLKEGGYKTFSISGDLMLTPQKEVKVLIKGCIIESDGKKTIVGFVQDIQEETELYNKLESERIKEQFLLSSDGDVLYEVDVPENRLISLNPEASYELFGLSDMNDFDGERRPYWELIHPDYREGFVDRFFDYNHMMIMPEHRMIYEYKIKNRSGDYIWVQHQAQVTLSRNGSVINVIGRISNINEQKSREYKNQYQADYDSLTGSLSRSALREQFDKALGNGLQRAIVLFNVNRFRYINNEYGFETGDAVLKHITITLWENQKGKCIVGRADSDTFVVAMLNVNEKDHPLTQIQKIFPKFAEPVVVEGKLINITLSASGSDSSSDKGFDALYNEAERALKVCKKMNSTYKNTYLIYNQDIEEQYEQLKQDTDSI